VRLLIALVVVACGCSPERRALEVVPSLSADCLRGVTVNEVRMSGLGDFPPEPATVVSTSPLGKASLTLPKGTEAIAVEGIGPDGQAAAFGRTGMIDLGTLFGSQVAIAYGPPDALCATGRMSFARAGHRATRLPSGNVLLSGGVDDGGGPVSRLEVYAPQSDLFGPAAAFRVVDVNGPTVIDKTQALGHAVSVLPAGDLLVTGGVGAAAGVPSGIASDAYLHLRPDATADLAPALLSGGPRAFHSTTSLADGRVVLIGGCAELDNGACVAGRTLGSTVIYDPTVGHFSDGPTLLHPRWDHDAVLRGDGSILIAGGRGEGGSVPPLEILDPDEQRPIDAGPGAGRAALLPTGAIALVGGVGAADARVQAWLSTAEAPIDLPSLPSPRSGHTVTVLDDGALLVAGGTGFGEPLVIYDGRGGARSLGTPYSRTGHTATRLDDGSVLLAGGAEGTGATQDAFLYLRSPLGPFSNLPTLTFDTPGDPILALRPARVSVQSGRLAVTADAAGEGGRPGELALVGGIRLTGVTIGLLVGRVGAAGAAVIFGWRSEADFAFVTLEPGQPVALSTVTSMRSGQSVVTPIDGCSGAALDSAELPDGDVAPITIDWRGGALTVQTPARQLLFCVPKGVTTERGQVGVGALHGTVLADDLAIGR
jgi:hypothetical protein